VAGEIEAGRSPVLAVVEAGHAVSVCFCARRSDVAAEAGLQTAEAFRGRGFGTRVTAAWALAIRASGRIPLYSTSWTNGASLAVARKLGLVAYASD
jgi:predicted GNAT family acetyltransferase